MCVSVRLCCAREGVRWHSVCRPRNYVAWYTLPAFRLPSEFRERRLSESTSVVAPGPTRRPSRPSRRALRSDPRSCHVIESHKSRALDGGSACRDMLLQCFEFSVFGEYAVRAGRARGVATATGYRTRFANGTRRMTDPSSRGQQLFRPTQSESHVTSQTRDSDTPRHSLNSHQSRRRTEFLGLGPSALLARASAGLRPLHSRPAPGCGCAARAGCGSCRAALSVCHVDAITVSDRLRDRAWHLQLPRKAKTRGANADECGEDIARDARVEAKQSRRRVLSQAGSGRILRERCVPVDRLSGERSTFDALKARWTRRIVPRALSPCFVSSWTSDAVDTRSFSASSCLASHWRILERAPELISPLSSSVVCS